MTTKKFNVYVLVSDIQRKVTEFDLNHPDTPPHPTPELSAMSLSLETDRSGDHEDPFNNSLLAAMDPGSSSEDEKMQPLALPVKLMNMKI